MKTLAITLDEFAASVLAVPPLARNADFSLNAPQNLKLIRHMEAGGHKVMLYAGNANVYHCSLDDYAQLLQLLAENTASTTRVIPAIGPDFGKMMDQARLFRGTDYRTAMVLPMQGFTTPEGVAKGIERFVALAGFPVTLYIKSESYIDIATLGKLVDNGSVLAVKYAVVRDDPLNDPYLDAMVQRLGASRIVSGMGERPAVQHLAKFGLASFTTGSGCIAPKASMAMFNALKRHDVAAAEALRARFMPMEDIRESISLIRVLHDAVSLSGLADMGSQLPLLSASPSERLADIRVVAESLLAFENGFSGQ